MNQEQILLILQLATLLAGNFIGGNAAQNIVALEELAAAVATAYQKETGKPIDPSIFTYEPPIGT